MLGHPARSLHRGRGGRPQSLRCTYRTFAQVGLTTSDSYLLYVAVAFGENQGLHTSTLKTY